MEKFLIIFDVRKKGISYFFFRDDKRRSAVNLKQRIRQRVKLNAGGLLETKGSKLDIIYYIVIIA